MMRVKTNARDCERERIVKPLFFARKTADKMFLEHEQGVHFDQTLGKFAVEALRE